MSRGEQRFRLGRLAWGLALYCAAAPTLCAALYVRAFVPRAGEGLSFVGLLLWQGAGYFSWLAALLRSARDRAGAQEVPLRDELRLVDDYLAIMRVRFRDRLTIEVSVEPEALACAVPDLVLQPLVERDRYARRLVVGARGVLRVVPIEEVDWLEAADNYVQVHARGDEHPLRETLRSLEAQLDPAVFVRVHRSIVVRIDRVVELRPQPTGDYVVVLRGGRELPMSRSYRDRVIERLG